MHLDRMEMLRGRLERVERDALPFDLWHWAAPLRRVGSRGELLRMAASGGGMCGCAAGHAAMDPAFRALGFRLDAKHADEVPEHMRGAAVLGNGWLLYPVFEGRSGVEAVAAFFGLSWADTEFLFLPHSYPEANGRPPARLVAQRVRTLMQVGSLGPSPRSAPRLRYEPADIAFMLDGQPLRVAHVAIEARIVTVEAPSFRPPSGLRAALDRLCRFGPPRRERAREPAEAG